MAYIVSPPRVLLLVLFAVVAMHASIPLTVTLIVAFFGACVGDEVGRIIRYRSIRKSLKFMDHYYERHPSRLSP